MPPPSFIPGAVPAQPAHIPRATQARLKDALARIRSVLLSDGPSKAQAVTDKAIQTLVNDPNVIIGEAAGVDAQQLKSQISQRFNSDLLTLWDEMDQEDPHKLATLVGYISELAPLLGSTPILLEWFDILLRPVLKDPMVSDRLAGQARDLVIMAALATPSSAYKDEPAPTALWPKTSESDQAREIGGAPYPKASVETLPADTNHRGGQPLSGEQPRGGSVGAAPMKKAGGQVIDIHRRFTQRLFDLYMQEASAPLRHDIEDADKLDALDQLQASVVSSTTPGGSTNPSLSKPANKATGSAKPYLLQALDSDDTKIVDVAGTTWKGNLEAIIITFGQSRPKEFFHHLSSCFEEPLHRIPIMLILSIFVRLNSIHTYHITKTALLTNVALSLQLDTSTTLVALCITSLIMLIPHVPDWIASGGAGGVPVLLAIFARIVDWRKLGPGWEHRVGSGEDLENLRMQLDEEHEEIGRLSKRLKPRPEISWKKLESIVDAENAIPPDPVRFFTIIYGIFPCNTVRFLRGPIDYLKKSQYQSPLDASWEDLIHEPELQKRSEPSLRRHALHPSLVNSNAELEITKKERWQQHDAADITAECVGLSVESWQALPLESPYDPFATELAALRMTAASSSSRRPSESHSLHRIRKMLASSSEGKEKVNQSGPSSGPIDEVLAEYSDLRWGGSWRRYSLTSPASLSPGPTTASRIPRTVTLSTIATGASMDNTSGALSSGPSSPVLGRTVQSTTSRPPSPSGGLWLNTATTPNQSSNLVSARGRTLNMASATSPPTTAPATTTPTHASFSSEFRPQFRSASGRPAAAPLSSVFASERSPSSLSSPIFPSRHPHNVAQSSAAFSALGISPSRANRGTAFQGSTESTVGDGGIYSVVRYLQRENLLLRGELNFELYLKDQHLRHIGRLHRDRILGSTSEAERQNLYRMVKSLRNQLSLVNAQMERQRNEANTTKSRHAQWENELQMKLKSSRDERRNWTSESRELRAQLEALQANHEAQTRQLNEASAELFELKTQMDSIAPKVIKVKEYEEKNAHLTRCLTLWDEDVKRFEEQRREMEILLAQWREMEMLLEASEEDRTFLEKEVERGRQLAEKLERERRQLLERVQRDAAKMGTAIVSGSNDEAGPSSLVSMSGRESEAKENLRRVERLEAEVLALRARAEEAEAEVARVKTSMATDRPRLNVETTSVREATSKSLEELQELLSSPGIVSSTGSSSLPGSVGTDGSGIDDLAQPLSPHLALAEVGAASASLGQVMEEAEAAEAEREATSKTTEGRADHDGTTDGDGSVADGQ